MSGRGRGDMELIRGYRVGEIPDQAERSCRGCGEKMKLIRAILNSDTGKVIYMFECKCGERTWED